MKTTISILLAVMALSSCQVNRRSMRESNYQIWLNKSDISYTGHKEGVADQTKIFGVDWHRLFGGKYEMGGINNLPADPFGSTSAGSVNSSTTTVNGDVINTLVSNFTNIIGGNSISRVEQYAINDLITKNPGYDLIMFPQFEVQKKWFLIGSKSKVIVKARLAKISPDSQ